MGTLDVIIEIKLSALDKSMVDDFVKYIKKIKEEHSCNCTLHIRV